MGKVMGGGGGGGGGCALATDVGEVGEGFRCCLLGDVLGYVHP